MISKKEAPSLTKGSGSVSHLIAAAMTKHPAVAINSPPKIITTKKPLVEGGRGRKMSYRVRNRNKKGCGR